MEMPIETVPTTSEVRAPWMMRESRSRPNSSVPSQCLAEGSLLAMGRFWSA